MQVGLRLEVFSIATNSKSDIRVDFLRFLVKDLDQDFSLNVLHISFGQKL